MASGYRDLIVWQKAMQVAKETYCVTRRMPKDELYSLTNQMRRAAVSIPSNIAEGSARGTRKDYSNFLRMASGSRAELETQVFLAVSIGYLNEEDVLTLQGLLSEVGRMLTVMVAKLSPKT